MQPGFLQRRRFALLLAVPISTALSALPAAPQTVTYEVKFQGNWTLESTPGGVVAGAHFTTLIGGVHGSGVTFWKGGEQASPGVEIVAESGSTGTFRGEVVASPHTLSVIQQGVSGGGTGTATFTVDVTRSHPLVTLLSMIGPSPDWFVGVTGLSLLDGANQWRQTHVVNLYPYDAGTEDGTEFSLSNDDTDPQGVITNIAGTGKFSNVPMAWLTFTRLTPAPEPSVSLEASPNPVDEGESVTVTASLSEALADDVTIPLVLETGTAESDDFGSLASITITGGQTTGAGTISTVVDADTDHETFTVSLGTLPPEVTAGDPSFVEVTIRDDEEEPPPPTVRLSASPNPVDEGRSVTVRARLSEALADDVTIPLVLAAGTAEPGDFGALASITITGGQTVGAGTISTVEDADVDDETFTVSLGALPPEVTAGDPSSVEVTIRDANPPAVRATCEPCTVPRGGEVRLRAEASDPDGDSISYDWSAAHGTFTGATDEPDARWTAPERIGTVVIRVEVADGQGGTAAAEVVVEVVNRLPVFGQPPRFEIAENRDGRGTPLTLGRVPVSDPDGDDVELGLMPGSDRFVIDAASGDLSHIGPGEDFEAGPNRYALTVVATDTLGGEARAEVVVHVVDVNERPAAADDTLSVAEDGKTRAKVLANDDDPDRADRLRVVSVGAPGHGQAQVVGAGVAIEYAPDPNYHGPDRFTYVVADAGGLADTATVEVTVTPVNDAPEAADDKATTPEDEAIEIPVLDNDTDIDGDRLRVQSVSPAGHGAAEVAADGMNLYYVPDPNYHGSDRFTYVVADAGGLADTATVEVTVTPVNDAPEADDDEATTPEDQAIEISVLDNDTDIDGDRLRVRSVSAAGNGTAEVAVDGTNVSYVPDPNYHGPDRFTYVVADAGGLADTATVDVTVTPVNDAPEAADDQATTLEDEAIEIPVLDNDVDIDGDRLHVRSVSAAGNGTAEVAVDGTNVSYVPDPNYHGPDRFTYVVADADGLADTASVEVTVVPVNDGPTAVGVIPDQMLHEGGDGVTVDLAPFFTDIDGDPLAFSAETSDAEVVTAVVRGTELVLVPVAYGDATVTVTATDPGGLAATQRVNVGVSDRAARSVLSDAFAAMARSYLSSARMTLERRVVPGARAGSADADRQSGLRVGGRSVALPHGHTFWDAVKEIVKGWLPDPGQMASTLGAARPAPGTELSLSDLAAPVRSSAGISGTDFTLAWGGQSADSLRPGIAWSLWGQADVQRYDGGAAGLGKGPAGIDGAYDGDLRVQYLGIDAQLPSWLFGVALSRSRGSGDWNAGTASGRLSTTMKSVHPYLRWSGGATSVWTTIGAGRGEARNERTETGRVGTSPLDLAMGLVEFQRRLGPARGPVAFGLRADAGWASLSTGEGTETIDDLRARVHQVRLGLDVRSEMRAGTAELAPFGAVHVRRDGGDGRIGRGVELAGGLRTRMGVVGVDVQGRWLAFHSATDYGESGAGLTLTVGGREEEGFSLSASPRWGGQTRGGFALWQDRAPGMTPGAHLPDEGWTMDLRGAYRARLRGRLLEVSTVYDRASGGQRLQLMGHIGLERGAPVPPR
ncbi:MAG: tandem-95 repeat protein [Acidobacteriota bacterium]|nr:tandem-95 repeat protein [Acidobacteriota bacterium]